MDLSSETETIFEPPSLYLTLQTWSVCSVKVWIHCRVPASHIFTVLSLELQESNCSQSQRLQSNQIWIDKETENSAKYRQTDRQTETDNIHCMCWITCLNLLYTWIQSGHYQVKNQQITPMTHELIEFQPS
jgi:hypothetical protein